MGCLKRSGGQCSLHGKDTSPSKNAHCNFGRLCIWYGWKYIPTASWKSIASPDIIGVTSGASVAAVFGILVLKLPTGIVSLLAVISGLLVSCLIYVLSQGGGFSNARLILTGIGMQAFLNAIISGSY